MFFWILGWALAGTPAELEIERGRVAIEAGDPMRAVQIAIDQLPSTPLARELLAEAFAGAGEGARAVVEVAAAPGAAPPFDPLRRDLLAAVARGDSQGAIATSKALAEGFADHPELHAPLWEVRDPDKDLRKYREHLVDQLVRSLIKRPEDAVYAYRVRILLHGAGRAADPAVDLLDALGEAGAARPAPLDRLACSLLADAAARSDAIALPAGMPRDVLEIALRAGEFATAQHRLDRALSWFDAGLAIQRGPDLATARARTLVALKRPDEAVAALEGDLVLAADPWPDDAAGIERDRRAKALAQGLAVRGLALEGVFRPLDAWRDLAVAKLLGEGDPRLEDRLRKQALPEQRALSASYPAPAPTSALDRAAAALSAGDAEAAVAHADAALVLFPWLGGTDWHQEASQAQAIRARALTALGRPDEARVAWAIALLLRPGAEASWWVDAAAAHRDAGHREIAFSRYATGLDRDPSLDLAPLRSDHVGPAQPQDAGRAVAIPAPVSEGAPDAVRVVRGSEIRFDQVRAVPKSVEVPARPPKVGERMPPWSVQTDAGVVDSVALAGRTSVLLFWVADCGPCLQAIHDAGQVARDLRLGGRDVAVVAVSVDPEARSFDALRQVQKVHVALAHSPELGQQLGVRNVPSVWIVDPAGTLRYLDVGWRGRDAFELALRQAMAH